jgi:3-oxosteroid 1-dehydrogenase
VDGRRGLIVDAAGQRFVNEAAPYSDVVHVMYDRNPSAPCIPGWLIVDQNYRNRYLFKDIAPTFPMPSSWFSSQAAHWSLTIGGLANTIGVPANALRATVDRFNAIARSGADNDFRCGQSAYDHYYTDPAIRPNSCLAPLWHAHRRPRAGTPWRCPRRTGRG